ncbi:MAG TPA: DUF2807 domain-containing protein, partial [Cytophagales bacterium]|nr:DUF2807 domain-containing protein [Cytophagales bacterium]
KKVSFYESCNVHFIVGNTYSVKIIAESNVIDHIEVSNIGGMLRIKPKDGICIQAQDLQVFITAPSIETIEAKGTTTLSGQINADQLSIIVDGTMDMNLAGYARQFSLLTHGTCDFHLYDMEVTTAMIQCDGTARGTIRCAEQLNIEVNGTAFIKYKGTPKISQQVSGSGSVINDN